MGRTLFDAYVIVDWSGSSLPKRGRDSVWWTALVRVGAGLEVRGLENPRTRRAGADGVRDALTSLAADGRRVLVGFDFPYGWPAGLADALAPGPGPAWRRTAELLRARIHDGDDNENDRFAVASALNAKLGPAEGPGPFWGCPRHRATPTLAPTSPSFPFPVRPGIALRRLRHGEARLPGVQETWKLMGAGSVGSQALLGVPRVLGLRDEPALRARSRLWPFETGFATDPLAAAGLGPGGPALLHAEIWPGVCPLDPEFHPVRDAAQVLSLAHHLARLDEARALGRLFEAPADLPAAARAECEAEEGWILGA